MTRRLRAGLVVAAMVSRASSAWGAEASDAQALLAAGNEQFKRQQYDAARESFAQAYALDGQAGTLLNLALAELAAQRPVEAAAHFRAYLASPGAADDKRGAVQSTWLPRAESQLARVELVVPAGAQVLVDGKRPAADPSLGVFEVVAGDHDIAVASAGRSATEHVTAAAGATVTMRVLVDDPVASPGSVGPVGPGAMQTPEQPPPSSPGPSASKIATVASLGAGALVGVGLGVGFALAATNKKTAIEGGEGCTASAPTGTPCQRLNFDVSVEHRDEWVSIGSYAGAGALAAAGFLAWLFWPEAPLGLSAGVGNREVGLAWRGVW